MHITETGSGFGDLGGIFLPLGILIMVPVGIYFLYTKTPHRKRLFRIIGVLFLLLTLGRGYLQKYYLIPEPTIPLRQAYQYLFFDKNWPKEFERKRQVYLQARASRPRLYYLYDFVLNPLWYTLLISLILLGIYTLWEDSKNLEL